MKGKSLELILTIAVRREEEAFDFYTNMIGKINDGDIKETLGFLASEEKKHKEMLLTYKDGKISGSLKIDEVVDYRIAEYLEEPEESEIKENKDVYLLAAHKELAAYNFYNALAAAHADGDAKQLLLKIANEEKKHKEKVEYLYSNSAFGQTSGG